LVWITGGLGKLFLRNRLRLQDIISSASMLRVTFNESQPHHQATPVAAMSSRLRRMSTIDDRSNSKFLPRYPHATIWLKTNNCAHWRWYLQARFQLEKD
jgi:hypothetical protein